MGEVAAVGVEAGAGAEAVGDEDRTGPLQMAAVTSKPLHQKYRWDLKTYTRINSRNAVLLSYSNHISTGD